MLTTILCDMGNVLLRYEPETFLDRYQVHDPQDRDLLRQEIFDSPLWPKMDWGELDEAGLESQVLPRLPERLHAVAHNLIFHWDEPVLPIPGMAPFLQDCKDAGLRLYLLSNASLRQPAYWPRVPGSSLFDGGIVSAFYRCVKPSPEIYHLALEKFRLSPPGVPLHRRYAGKHPGRGGRGHTGLSLHRGCPGPAPAGCIPGDSVPPLTARRRHFHRTTG